jgi:hypothetical protein
VLKKSYAAAFQEQAMQYKPDAVQLQQIGFGQKVALENLGFQHDAYLHAFDNRFDLTLAEQNHNYRMEEESLKAMMTGSKSGTGKGRYSAYLGSHYQVHDHQS